MQWMKCVSLLAIALCACASTSAAPPPAPAPAPAPALEPTPTPAPGAIWPPPGYVEPKCQLQLSTSLKRRGKAYEVTAIAKNTSGRAINFDVPDRCPQGPIVFAGLPDGYDYYQSCTKGACISPRKPITFSVAAGESIELTAVEVEPAGANCASELPSGRYSITFGLSGSVRTCAGTFGSFEYQAHAQKP